MDKPKVDYIGGLSPAISIEQKSVSKNPRSTVGTITEVLDYLRVLFSRAGTQHCPQCGRAIEPISPQMVADRLLRLPAGTRFQLIAPLTRSRKGDHTAILEQARSDGFTRARIDGEMYELQDMKKLPRLLKSQPHTLEIIVDRLVVPFSHPQPPHPALPHTSGQVPHTSGQVPHTSGQASRRERGEDLLPSPSGGRVGDEGEGFSTRVIDSVETALRAGKGNLIVQLLGAPEFFTPPSELLLSEHNVCPHCQITLPALTAALFSFNAPTGMCPECNGLGTKMQVDPALIVEHPDLSILDGASRWWGNVRKKRGWRLLHLDQVARHFGADLELPWKDLPQVFRDALIWGSEEKFAFKWENEQGTWKGEGIRQERGAVYDINRLFRQTSSEGTRRWYGSFMSQKPCSVLRWDAPVRRSALRHRRRDYLPRGAGYDHPGGVRLGVLPFQRKRI